jgi:hypothetical protein
MMSARRLTVLWAVIVTTTLVANVLRLTGVLPGDTLDFTLGLGGLAITTSTLGTLILRSDPKHRVGTAFLVLGCVYAVSVVMRLVATSFDPASTRSGVIGIVEEVVRIWGVAGMGVVLLIFPTGHLLGRRWRLLVYLLVVGWTIGVLQQTLVPGVIDGVPSVHNPIATAATGRIAHAMQPLFGIAGIAFLGVAIQIVVRYIRSGRMERQQIKLFGTSVVGVILLIVSMSVLFPKQMDTGILGSIVWQTIWIFPPAAATVAILRHGLFDIDRIISRTITYAIVTAILVGGYIGLVIVFQAASRPITGRSDLAVAASTLIMAAIFMPLRKRVQNAVDHRFNRKRYDAEQTIESFSARLAVAEDGEVMKRPPMAWVVFAVTASSLAFAATLPDDDWPLEAISFLGVALLFASLCGAALVASRRPDNAVGWILLAIALSLAGGLFATQYANRTLVDAPGSLPGGLAAAWFQSWLWTPLTGLFPLLVLVFPTGSLPSRRWRPVLWAIGTTMHPTHVSVWVRGSS